MSFCIFAKVLPLITIVTDGQSVRQTGRQTQADRWTGKDADMDRETAKSISIDLPAK